MRVAASACAFSPSRPEDLIDEALARGLLKPEDRADWWAVIQACYAAQLSDVALERLANGRVITREQRGDAVAILRSISNWLEQAGCSAKWRSEASLQIHDIRRKRYRASTCRSTLRARRHRERRRERLRLFTVEVPEDLIEEALARDLLKPEDRADWWAVIQACYAAQLSDVALNWLTNGGVITREQRGDAVAILHSISNWLEHAGMNRIQNHKEGGIASVYYRHHYAEETKHIMEMVAARIMALAEGREAAGNVVALRA